MANTLNEMNYTQIPNGRPVDVIPVQIPVVPDRSAVLCINFLRRGGIAAVVIGVVLGVISYYASWDWQEGLVIAACCFGMVGIVMALVGYMGEVVAGVDLSRQEQTINTAAATVDNYLTQRVTVMKSMAEMTKEAVHLDRQVFRDIAAMRSGTGYTNEEQAQIERLAARLQIVLERYPELKSHEMLRYQAQQDAYYAASVTEARNRYNSVVNDWNQMIYGWPFYQYVAGMRTYTTRVPYTASADVKRQGEDVLYHAD